jgi:methylenetetrahydrofolate reductase (NADPH)
MRFAEFYARATRPIISFEVYPPKPDSSPEAFHSVLAKLVDLGPDFMTVTYGAFGSTRIRTIEIAEMIRREFGIECACHLTCVGSSAADIERIVGDIRRAGIENIVALRGDPPQESETPYVPTPGGYLHADQLVTHIRSTGGFGIAVACYPEKHLEAPDLETDLAHLKGKVDAGADIAITQLFYDNRHYFRLVERARAIGIGIPIVPGILPIVSLGQVKRITSMCGASIPPDLFARLEAVGGDGVRALEVGVSHAVAQARELLAAGVPGIHFYVLNRAKHMQAIFEQLAPGIPGTDPGIRSVSDTGHNS